MTASEHAQPADGGLPRRSPGLVSVRLLRVVLWLLVMAGPVTAGWVAVRVGALAGDLAAVTGQMAATAPAVDTAGVEGFAELAVAESLRRADSESGPDGENGRPVPVDTVSVGVEQVTAGYFAVTVAVSQPPSDVAFYTVGVASTDTGWVAVSSPSLVAAPTPGPAPSLAVSATGGVEEAGLEEALEGFVAALLAGDGDIDRYVAPGSTVAAVRPAPFTSVQVTAAGSTGWGEGKRLVVAEVEGDGDGDAVRSLTYPVVFTERDGRWEVAELLAAPPLGTEAGGEEGEGVIWDD